MNSTFQQNPLPEKVVRRHAELLEEILPDFSKLVIEENRPADSILNAFLRTRRELGSRDRRFLAQAVFAYFRWYGWTVQKLRLSHSEACLLGTALESTELAQSFQYLETRCNLPFKIECMGALTTAEKRDKLNELMKDQPGFQPLEMTDLVLEEFPKVVDPGQVDACISSFQQRPPTWIRARDDAAKLAEALNEKGHPAALHDRIPGAVSVDPGISLQHVLREQAAQYVVQDLASQCVGLAAAPEKDGDWWDCCAGAGGKALQLMDLMGTGKVLSTDVRVPALKELKKRARKYGIKNIRTQTFNAVNDEPFTKVFDGVMVDAPCSGWGTWNRNPDARWRASRRDVIQCATRQLKILNNVKWCVKPGGLLIYAVCTVTRPETEEVVMNFLDHHSGFKLEPFANPLTGELTDGQLQIWPWDGPGDGMFIARLRRTV
ncbi:RsmB/NOP family class I SAM-dependent RNA methyltransferase [Pontiella sp.]|uniref:RsmB/NOP family class I SAM-dependent RNA methyltransferase n=1 Tax=Pontiella sp. TaxID=2837462 RepID=UPI003561D8D7